MSNQQKQWHVFLSNSLHLNTAENICAGEVQPIAFLLHASVCHAGDMSVDLNRVSERARVEEAVPSSPVKVLYIFLLLRVQQLGLP